MARVISGITSTGKLTLGNYLGAINNFLQLQEEHELLIFVANLHGLTLPITAATLKNNIKDIAAWYFAAGLNPGKTHIFIQSDVLAHTQLGYILLCHSYLGELQRMTQFKDKSQKHKTKQNQQANIPTGLLIYPTLMAADILLYDAKIVPVGFDQRQHLELTRTLASRMNNLYNFPLFTIPEAKILQKSGKIMSLLEPIKKMSKSDSNVKNVIFLDDKPEMVAKKIQSAITDSENIIKFDIINKPGVSNLLNIYASITKQDIVNCEKYFKGHDYKTLKNEVTRVINELLLPIQTKYHNFLTKDATLLDAYLQKGANYANTLANKKLALVQNSIGLNYRNDNKKEE